MAISALSAVRKQAYKLVAIPIGAIVFISFIALFLQGSKAFYSALLGGACWALPNFYFAYKIFSDKKIEKVGLLLKRFYKAEIIKLFLTAILFVIIVKFLAVAVFVFLLAFIIAQITFWMAIFFNLSL